MSEGSSVRALVRQRFLEGKEGEAIHLPHVTVPPLSPSSPPNEVLQAIVEKLRETRRAAESAPPALHPWRRAVPPSLRGSDAAVVNYLCMLIAVDFRHWSDGDETAPVSVGEVVANYRDFYAVADAADAEEETAETSTATAGVRDGPVLVRGSAAMVCLLRRAVEREGVHWYDVEYLRRYTSVAEAGEGLAVAWEGCRADGVTPMRLPAAAARVGLLLELRDRLDAAGCDWFGLLQRSGGALFAPRVGLVSALVALHPRYDDRVGPLLPGEASWPVWKLAQLTALAVAQALPGAVRPEDLRELTIACDYQIPRALRAAGLLVYDAVLADAVARRVLLAAGGVEEAAIRLGALMATERLLEYVRRTEGATGGGAELVPWQLDYPLWLVGRQLPPSTAPHHVCRTIMY